MHGLLEGALEEHMGRLRGMTQRIADKAAADARFKELQHLEEVRPASPIFRKCPKSRCLR